MSQKASDIETLLDGDKPIEDIKKEQDKIREDLIRIYKQAMCTMERMYRVRNWFIQIAEIA